ncbi:hypothetical protein ACQKWADRAFT_307762 [Trichoderma austrokoningii]
MKNRISKAGSRRPYMRLSKGLQEQLLDAATDLPPQSLVEARLPDVPVKSAKRQLEETDQSAAKRPCLSIEVNAEKQITTQATTIQHPRPKPAHAVFLGRFIEPSQPDPRPDSLDSFISEWLQSVGSNRNTHCRSDSFLAQLGNDPVPRQLAKSAPQVEHTRDADGFIIPPTPVSTGSRSQADIDGASEASDGATRVTRSSSRASGRNLVEDPLYREMNLALNNIYLRPLREQLPSQIAELVSHMRRDRDSPGPSTEQVWKDALLNELWMGTGERNVESYFRERIFLTCLPEDILDYSSRQPMARHTVPNARSNFKVSNPVPDMLYGYRRHTAFPQQQIQLASMAADMVANSQNLLYPFFTIEFKGDGPSGSGSLWTATNQCIGGAVSCVNIAERLNRQLEQCKSSEIHFINSAAFGIAMSGTEARLYVSWKHDQLIYYMANFESFLLHRPDHYIDFRKYVLNILDWGRNERLAEIRSSLDILHEESRKTASEAARSRPPPSDSSNASSKRGSSSSRRLLKWGNKGILQ